MSDRLCMLPEESVLDQCPWRVDLVNDGISIPIITSCKHSDLIVSVSGTEAFVEVWPDKDTLVEHAIIARRWLHLHPLIRLRFDVMPKHLLKLKLIFVSLWVNQCLVKVKDQQLVEAGLFELKLDFIFLMNLGKLLDLLNDVDCLYYLHRYLFVHRHFQWLIWEILILLKYILRFKWRCWRRFLWMRGFLNRTSNISLTLAFTTRIILAFTERFSM